MIVIVVFCLESMKLSFHNFIAELFGSYLAIFCQYGLIFPIYSFVTIPNICII